VKIFGTSLFGLVYFYVKQLMQINKILCIIHELVKVIYEDTIFVRENI
jgi:hypothetical protein